MTIIAGKWHARLVNSNRGVLGIRVPEDLSGETVLITLRPYDPVTATYGPAKVADRPCDVTVVSSTESYATWQPTGTDLDTPGVFHAEFNSTEPGEEPRRLGYVEIKLIA